MQQPPLRLSQTIWSAFRAAKPVHKHFRPTRQFSPVVRPPSRPWTDQKARIAVQARFYSEKLSDIDAKAEDAKKRIQESLESRADAAAHSNDPLKSPQEETIVHTLPEASSIVHPSKTHEQKSPDVDAHPRPSSTSPETPPPSSTASQFANLQHRFAHFMDNFQTHVFTASRRLNDLTGYSGIEVLKNEIETQESIVQKCRKEVKEARETYTEAVAKRAATQREVNDLLHRKHTWTPTDLERFTSLYRSDHANELAEAAAQKSISDAEQWYEEASTKLGRAILARYHEEQIWSDKIRQMSTWGTWGLMGINVLLFVIFQIVLEPWRRRRLVKGFEEKVELAIKESQEDAAKGAAATLATATTTVVQPNQSAADAVADMTAGEKVEAVADNIAEQIVDAVTGTSLDNDVSSSSASSPSQSTIAARAADSLVTTELASEAPPPDTPTPTPVPPPAATPPTSIFARYDEYVRSLFSDDIKHLVSQRELTTVAMEGVAAGMALMGLLFVALRPR